MQLTTLFHRGLVSSLCAATVFTTSLPLTADPVLDSPVANFSLTRSTSGSVRMLTGTSGAINLLRTGQDISVDVANQFAPAFGIQNPQSQLMLMHDKERSGSRRNIRYQQTHDGVPVIGAELIANINAQQQLSSMSGETAKVTVKNTKPAISAADAESIAIAAVAKWHSLDAATLNASNAELKIYDPSLIGPGNGQQLLVWQTNVTPDVASTVNEYILIDARSGAIALHFNTVDHVLNRETYTANGVEIIPGTLVCNESNPSCAGGNTDAQNAHRYAADTYNFYFNNHGRDSLDDAGMTLVSTVQFGTAPNAGWLPAPYNQMVYGPGFSNADDVVGHELTHGVTSFSSNLFYYYQSGAINESLSDLWGEFIDLTNTGGNDAPSVRWKLGEDAPGGAIRDMANPTLFGDPDRMSSGNYWTLPSDNGGVHINSGINNKAVYLMTDGGTFNGQTVTGLGITKTAAIYYEAQTNLLTSGSDYKDLYNALNQACQNLIGVYGITLSDCTEVNQALLAVEMNEEPSVDFNPDAALCSAGSLVNASLFYDDFESGLSNWTPTNITGTTSWVFDSTYATSGTRSVAASGTDVSSHSVFTQNIQITIPESGYYLHFYHAFDYENAGGQYYDGAKIEYSIDNGANWADASGLIDSGRDYTGNIFSGTGNPLAGQTGFVGSSHGFNSTRLDLSSLAGESIRLRFVASGDASNPSLGWQIDDVRIYNCVSNSAPVANAGADQNVLANVTVNLNGAASNDPDTDALFYAWTQQAGPSITLNGAGTATPSFVAPAAGGIVEVVLTVTDAFGQSSTDVVSINVNGIPTADAGTDQTVDLSASVNLNGSASADPEALGLTYSWVQNSGTSVSLSSTTVANPSFTAPAAVEDMSFTLTVTDNVGQMDTDTVTIRVRDLSVPPPPPPSNDGGGSGCSLSETGRFDPLWLMLLGFLSLLHFGRAYTQQRIRRR